MEWFELIRKPGALDFLTLTGLIGALLAILSLEVRPPLNEKLRRIGASLAGFAMGGIMSMVILGIELNFQILEPVRPIYMDKFTKYEKPKAARKNFVGEALANYTGDKRIEKLIEELKKYIRAKENKMPAAFYEVAEWAGKEHKKTQIFKIPSKEWIVYWDTAPEGNKGPGEFSIKLYTGDGTFTSLVCNIKGADMKDKSIIHSSGKFYLEIKGTQPYVVVIKAKYPNHHEG